MTPIRILAGVLAAFYAFNGATMIFASRYWYDTTPGVPGTGPYNPHFVVDIGLMYLVSAACLALWALRPGYGAALPVIAAAWPALHAVFHILGFGHHMPEGMALVTELAGVVGLALLGIVIAWRAAAVEGRPS